MSKRVIEMVGSHIKTKPSALIEGYGVIVGHATDDYENAEELGYLVVQFENGETCTVHVDDIEEGCVYEICDSFGNIISVESEYNFEDAVAEAERIGGATINRIYYPLDEDMELDLGDECRVVETVWSDTPTPIAVTNLMNSDVTLEQVYEELEYRDNAVEGMRWDDNLCCFSTKELEDIVEEWERGVENVT